MQVDILLAFWVSLTLYSECSPVFFSPFVRGCVSLLSFFRRYQGRREVRMGKGGRGDREGGGKDVMIGEQIWCCVCWRHSSSDV